MIFVRSQECFSSVQIRKCYHFVHPESRSAGAGPGPSAGGDPGLECFFLERTDEILAGQAELLQPT